MSEATEPTTQVVKAEPGEKCHGQEDFAKLARALCHPEQETFVVVCLGNDNKVLCKNVVAMGTLDNVAVSLRDVFREAVRHNAYAVAAAHNHPSGDPTPSKADEESAQAIVRAAHLLGFQVADVAVVTLGEDPQYRSILQSIMEREARAAFGKLREMIEQPEADEYDFAPKKAKKEVLPS